MEPPVMTSKLSSKKGRTAILLSLISETNVSRLPDGGIRMEVSQQVYDALNPTKALPDSINGSRSTALELPRKELSLEDVETLVRAHMRAILLALDMAHQTIYDTSVPGGRYHFQHVVIYSTAPAVVWLINHYIDPGADSIEKMPMVDRTAMERISRKVQTLSRWNGKYVSVSIHHMPEIEQFLDSPGIDDIDSSNFDPRSTDTPWPTDADLLRHGVLPDEQECAEDRECLPALNEKKSKFTERALNKRKHAEDPDCPRALIAKKSKTTD